MASDNGNLEHSVMKKELSGYSKVDKSYMEEAYLYRNFKSCQKHPDHKGFIPIDTFDITHLPTDYQDRGIVEYIQLVAQFTVLLTIRSVSPNRPATVPGTETPYPFYEKRGENVTRVGTGLITGVYGASQNPLTVFLEVRTATHLVFDSQETQNATCHFFFDSGRLQTCPTVIEMTLSGSQIQVNTITDECMIRVETKNFGLAQKFNSMFQRLQELKNIIRDKLATMSDSRQEQPLTFIVSHPHGCSKTISIGRCVEVDDNLDDVRFLYTTPTCVGSGGAAVFCLHKQYWDLNCVHNGTWKSDTRLNLGVCRYYTTHCFLNWPINDCKIPFKEHQIDCRLANTFPAEGFLPPDYRFNLVVDYIRAWTELCVQLDVKYISKNRPDFWPGSQLPYPWCNERGSLPERKGCGWVDRVTIYPNESSLEKSCDCEVCEKSSTPERKFAHIYIQTSTSLVFDQSEGNETKCWVYCHNFCLDRTQLEETSSSQPVRGNVETDRCQLVFVTHDIILAEKLNALLSIVSLLKDKIQKKISYKKLECPISIILGGYAKTKIDKCVRVGEHLWYKKSVGIESIGAPVFVLGDKYLTLDVSAHTGDYPQESNLGYSGYLRYQ